MEFKCLSKIFYHLISLSCIILLSLASPCYTSSISVHSLFVHSLSKNCAIIAHTCYNSVYFYLFQLSLSDIYHYILVFFHISMSFYYCICNVINYLMLYQTIRLVPHINVINVFLFLCEI